MAGATVSPPATEKGETMEFGYFAQVFVPDSVAATQPGYEQRRLLDNLELSVKAEEFGFKYVWASEHHFLREYSHMSSPEVFLSFVAARTSRIHLGSAIFNITAPVNHPVRTAERAAMLDNLSNGRFELGTGRGSSTTEMYGFGIPEMDRSKELWDESIRQLPAMWRDGFYSYEGTSFSVPPREVFPKPAAKPHPPLWVAAGNPPTFEKAGRMGLGVLCFTIGAPSELAKLIEVYKKAVAKADPVGDFVNDNVMCVTHLCCMPDRQQAIELNTRINMRYYQSLVYRWLDTFPKPAMVPDWPAVMPEPTAEEIAEQVEAGIIAVGDPDDCARVCRQYQSAGADQLVVSPMTTTMPFDVAAESMRLFGETVIPQFDTDPTFRSDRMRAAAQA
jgi:alkanesulfonate monooxygenase SsuD/methylene tetrahydromethanopterin reductase-like flavin-dependent oxidoreductase (luciferase family)